MLSYGLGSSVGDIVGLLMAGGAKDRCFDASGSCTLFSGPDVADEQVLVRHGNQRWVFASVR